MEIFEIIWPGTLIDDPDKEWSQRTEFHLSGLTRAYKEAYLTLYLFNNAYQGKEPPNFEGPEDFRAKFRERMNIERMLKQEAESRLGPSERSDWNRFKIEVSRIKTEKIFASGKLPHELMEAEVFIHARSFLYALDFFERILGKIAADKKASSAIKEIYRDFIGSFPTLRATRNSAQHMDERLDGLGVNSKPIKPKPVNTSGVVAPNGALVIDSFSGPSTLMFTTADGDLGEIDVSAQSMKKLQQSLQRIIDSYKWDGPSKYFPN